MTMIYLAGPIDLVSKDESMAWRNKFASELASRGMSSFNPAAAFKFLPQNADDARTLVDINTAALHRSDFVVFVMGKSIPSIGTPMELMIAKQRGISHVVIWEPSPSSFNDDRGLMAPITHAQSEPVLPAYITAFADKVVYRFDDALDYVVDTSKNKGIGISTGFMGTTTATISAKQLR